MQLGDVTVGSTLMIAESGVPVPYLIVHQGTPSASMYRNADGTWCLRKDVHSKRVFSDPPEFYPDTDIDQWLNTDYLSLLDMDVQGQIKLVKVPYINNTDYYGEVAYGDSGASCKVFVLSAYEIGYTYQLGVTTNLTQTPDGRKLTYFWGGYSDDAAARRTANMTYSTRSLTVQQTGGGADGRITYLHTVYDGKGHTSMAQSDEKNGIRPSFVLTQNVEVEQNPDGTFVFPGKDNAYLSTPSGTVAYTPYVKTQNELVQAEMSLQANEIII